jgi:ADP-heptose:LPS heptosyltransferase
VSATLLVLRALGLGDLLTAVPALRALAEAFPDHRRVLAAPRALAPLALHTGAVAAVLDAAALSPLAVDGRVDVAVNLHGRGPQSHRVLTALRPGRLLAFAHPAVTESAAGPAWHPDEHEVARWCRMLRESGVAADPARLDLEPPPGEVPPQARGATLIHPGAGAPARMGPVERWAEVARAERRAGRPVIVTGRADERGLSLDLARWARLPARVVLAGHTDVLALARLVAAAGRVVCADTGIAHLATALGTPSVVLFGPVPPAAWGPPPTRTWHRALWAGRTGDPNGPVPDAGLLRLRVADVLRALAALPARGVRAPVPAVPEPVA